MTDVVVLSFAIALIRRGKISSFPKFYFIWALIVSVALQFCSQLIPTWSGIFVCLSYLFVLAFFISNRQHEDMRIFMIGWLLNALVIWANAGKMPVDLEQASKLSYPIDALINGTDFKHIALTAETKLSFLADIIYKPFIIPRVISIGDIFIMLGTFLLVQRLLNKPISLIRLREGKNYAVKHSK
ncbi:hypothetical protein J31TS6_33360 [Brevibacillus reuszeri]|uniref:DUF5317 domain-containing protein n=1 Tax=Brevibacillus reuszeri TaxID=54915 RepID=UPI001B27EE5B|nr:DUF5317 domain-containing protein [Brevibacillus reuszeri]GIO07308.1 hypothetical protein J31TS6_33360 [Brevibacillus reuszeri]